MDWLQIGMAFLFFIVAADLVGLAVPVKPGSVMQHIVAPCIIIIVNAAVYTLVWGLTGKPPFNRITGWGPQAAATIAICLFGFFIVAFFLPRVFAVLSSETAAAAAQAQTVTERSEEPAGGAVISHYELMQEPQTTVVILSLCFAGGWSPKARGNIATPRGTIYLDGNGQGISCRWNSPFDLRMDLGDGVVFYRWYTKEGQPIGPDLEDTFVMKYMNGKVLAAGLHPGLKGDAVEPHDINRLLNGGGLVSELPPREDLLRRLRDGERFIIPHQLV